MASAWHVRNAAAAIHAGGVIAYPTEAVWGLGCDPWDQAAVEKILHLKQRSIHKGLILVAANLAQIAPLVEGLSDIQLQRLKDSWPGPFTWLLPDPSQWVPEWIKGQHQSVAVRVSAHLSVRELCQTVGGAVVSTSANPAGAAPAKTRLKVLQYFGNGLDYALPGGLGTSLVPTQVRDLLTNQVIREG